MMRPRNAIQRWKNLSPVAWVCLATGLSLLGVALLATIVNYFVGNWFQSGGLAIVGLFYLALFLGNLPPRGIAAIGAAECLANNRQPHEELAPLDEQEEEEELLTR